jgi:Tfp pilus assembly protein PilF
VQREISLDVSDKLRLRLSGESKERLTRAYTGNAEAYQLYLKGRYSWEKWTLEGAKQAVEYFQEAIKKDPNYALAYAGLADVYIFGAGKGAGLPQKEAHRRAREAATKALSLDPQLGEAHAALAEVILYDRDFAGAEREFKRALELNPSYAEGHHEYSHLLLLLGRIDESFAESKISRTRSGF